MHSSPEYVYTYPRDPDFPGNAPDVYVLKVIEGARQASFGFIPESSVSETQAPFNSIDYILLGLHENWISDGTECAIPDLIPSNAHLLALVVSSS